MDLIKGVRRVNYKVVVVEWVDHMENYNVFVGLVGKLKKLLRTSNVTISVEIGSMEWMVLCTRAVPFYSINIIIIINGILKFEQ